MNLSPRLRTIADLVPTNSIVADIGTDHGYIPVYLIKKGIAKKVIACDINEGPLENARTTSRDNNLQNIIETRLGSGLKPIKPDEVNTVIIAGMGGLLIADILMTSIEVVDTVKNFILQPMTAQEELRKWLEEHNFKITNEKLAKEGDKIYEIIVAVKGKMVVKDTIYYELGYNLIKNKDPYLIEYINLKIEKYSQILNEVLKLDSTKANQKKLECIEKINKLKKVKKCL